jgi:hypothetical protein
MTQTLPQTATQALAFALALGLAFAAPTFAAAPAPQSCAAQLKVSQDAVALADVKMQEEIERSDAQTYLTRLELSVTKQKLAAALAKCGAACAPTPAAGASN